MAAPQLQKFPLLSETVLDLIRDQLQANFNLELKQLDNQYNDRVNLEPVADSAIHYTDLIQTLSVPCIYILPGPNRFVYTEKPNYMESEHLIEVVVSAEDVGADILTLKVMRYARVLYGLLNLVDLKDSNGRLEVHPVAERLGYTQPISQKLSTGEQKYRMDCVLSLKAQCFEKNLI